MLRSYLTVAVRSLLKRRGYSAINIIGLGTGIAAVIIILLFAQHELSYDRFHSRADDIHLVYKERVTPTGTQITRDTWVPLGDRLEREYPVVETSVRLWATNEWVRVGDQRFEETVTYTDQSLFKTFSFPLAAGDPATALEEPGSVVLSTDMAAKYFGERNPIGQSLRIENVGEYVVSGVLEPIPGNSSIEIDLAIPLESASFYEDVVDEWGGSFISTYVLLRDGADPLALEAQFPALVREIWDAEVASRTNVRLEALPDLYNALTGNRQYAFIMMGVALIILVIAAINFINLATARSLERASEIGMRKVLGAHRRQLIQQFMGEATVLTLVSLALAVVAVAMLLPVINNIYGLELALAPTADLSIPIALLLFGLGLGLLAGAYPAIFISKFGPIATLRGGPIRSGESSGTRLRHALVVAQFALAVALMAGTLVMRDQIQYMQSAELKFDSENVVVVNVGQSDFEDREEAARRLETFKAELENARSVTSVASSSHSPGRWAGWFTFATPEGWGNADPLRMRVAFVDHAFFETYGISLREGRTFDPNRATDEQAVVVNEAALAAFGWEHPEGRTVRRGDQDYTVIGVAGDYHFSSLREEIAPVLHFYRAPDNAVHNFVTARLAPGGETEALATMARAWQSVDSSRPLPYEFADRTFAQLYERELQLAAVVGTFSGLAILIACLGLFGLAAWSVTHRLKEVGIRKVLGASAAHIVLLLSRDFMRLVAVALVVAVPIGYLAIREWLADFAYQVSIDASLFVFAAVGATVIAFITVSALAARAAFLNPVQTLRYQ